MIATVPVQAATTPEFKVGDLLEVKDVRGSKSTSFLAMIESVEEGVYTLMLSDGIVLEGTTENLIRWGYKRLWSIGDKVTPKRSPGSRYGTITGFNIKKKAPLLVKFDSYKVESQMAKDAVVLAPDDEPSEAIRADEQQSKPIKPKPLFSRCRNVRLKRGIQPIPEGTTVNILSVSRRQGAYLYEVTSAKGKVWAYESDLEALDAIPDPEDQELGNGELCHLEFTIALSNGMKVQVKADEWGEGTIQLDFHGAVSISGFRSDHWEGDLSNVSGYAQQKAQQLFDELPRDCDGHPLFTNDRCEVVKGAQKGLIDEVAGLYEGKLYFREEVLKSGFFAPDRLRRVEQGEISLKVLGAENTETPTEEFKPATHYTEGDWVTGFTLSKHEATGRFVGYSLSGMLRVDCSTSPDPDTSCVKMIDPATARLIDPPESSLATVEDSELAIDPRTQLVDEINQLSGQLEEAQEVAESADRSALQFAKEIGDRLLALKPQVEHGEWEAFREANIKSPRTGKPMASSTATLCQRVAKRWAELQEQGIESLKQASLTLRKPQQIEQAKSATVADLPEAELEPAATIEQPEINLEEVERRGELIGDLVPPTWGELKSLYSQLGKVSGWGNGIAVESERLAFSAIFQTREEAWEKWQKKYKPALDRLANQQTGQESSNSSTPDSAIDNSDDEPGVMAAGGLVDTAPEKTKSDRVEHDYYPTPEPITEALLKFVDIKGQVFDCCDGTSSISKFFYGSITNELYPQPRHQPDYQGDASDEALWNQVDEEGGIDWVVTNPPYGLELPVQILAHAVQHARVGVAMLLRISFLEPCRDRSEWMTANADQLRYVIPVNPRPQFRADIKGGDCFTVAWFVWVKDWSWETQGIDCPFKFITDWNKGE